MIDDLSIAEDRKSDSSQEACAMIHILPNPRVANVRSISAMPVSLPERSELVCQWGRANDGGLICTWRQAAPDFWLLAIPGADLTAGRLPSGAELTRSRRTDLALI